MTTQEILEAARSAKSALALADNTARNAALLGMADALCSADDQAAILAANAEDMAAAKGHISDVMLDRLALTAPRIEAMAQGIREVAALPDPVGRVLNRVERPNGLVIEKTAVPMGVIAIIYESRPNVTSDAAALAIKSGNACILRCGKEAWRSANAIVTVLRQGLKKAGLPETAVCLIEDTTHASANALMTAVGYVDLLIPRGGAGLIRACVQNAKVPCIQTGTGICHVYVDDTADLDKALDIIENALGIPMWISALVIALAMAVVVMGGVKRISSVASMLVPPMVGIYLIATVVILIANAGQIPSVIAQVVSCAFGSKEALLGGGVGIAIQQGVKRGTFSSASGMGESMPTAAAAETSHPIKQGMANAAGVWLDTVIVCTASGLMMLLSGCYNTQFGYIGGTGAMHDQMAQLAADGTYGVIFVQNACSTVMGSIAPLFIAIMLALFSFTCLISYYYEGETSVLYLFQGDDKAATRKVVIRIMQIVMPILIFIWGNIDSGLAWNLSDLALGGSTWINMLVVLLLSPKVFALYKDYEEQMKAKKDPYYNPDKLCWKGVDVEMWKDINKKRIAEDK